MKKNLLLLTAVLLITSLSKAQSTPPCPFFDLVLEVWDYTKGAGPNINGDKDVFCWASPGHTHLSPENVYWMEVNNYDYNGRDWEFPMYDDGTGHEYGNGWVEKRDDVWIYYFKMSTTQGSVNWTPYTYSSNREKIYTWFDYVGDGIIDNEGLRSNLKATIGPNGEIGGQYRLIIKENANTTMKLVTKAPEGTQTVYINALYPDSDDAELLPMNYDESLNAFTIDIDGNRIPNATVLSYSYYLENDWFNGISEVDLNGEYVNRELFYVGGTTVQESIINWDGWEPNSIDSPISDKASINVSRNLVSVNNAKSVQIFTLDGIMVDNQPSVDGFYQTTLSNGLYLIKADNNVSKLVVK